jgi:DNA polymerase (family X)
VLEISVNLIVVQTNFMPVVESNKQSIENNIALASIFHQMADCYRYMGNEEHFRAIAYENVAKVLYSMKEDIADYANDVKTLEAIGGIGESIAEKIIEYLRTGTVKTFEQLKKETPYQLLQLMDITGFGPATLKMLHEKLHINNREELIRALDTGALQGLGGFGEKRIENMKKVLKVFKETKRMLLKRAEKIASEILNEIKEMPGVQRATVAGSLRRKKETIGDIDIIIQADPAYRKKIVARFIALPQVEKVLAKGVTKASVLLKFENVQVDIRLVNDYEYGAALLYFTGSKEHVIKLRMLAKKRGYKINEYGIFNAATGKRLAGATEEEMYNFLELQYIPPEQRVDKGEIENAVIKNN